MPQGVARRGRVAARISSYWSAAAITPCLLVCLQTVGVVGIRTAPSSDQQVQLLSPGGVDVLPEEGSNAVTYTTNFLCLRRYCINPVFPALMEYGESVLEANAARSWTCNDNSSAHSRAHFCGRVIAGYKFSLPDDAETTVDPIEQQDQLAMAAYVAHIAGMGMDYWVSKQPWLADECKQSIWKMTCFTHFPKCNTIDEGAYLRPCVSSCQAYIKQCGVQCCDEGVQCVFRHHRMLADGTNLVMSGYDSHLGPSSHCTGAAARTAISSLASRLLCQVFACAGMAWSLWGIW